MSDTSKVICVGTPPELLESRRLVLQSAGYDATCVAVSEAPQLLLTSGFDFMIISATVIENDRVMLRQAAGEGMRIVQLNIFLLGLMSCWSGFAHAPNPALGLIAIEVP